MRITQPSPNRIRTHFNILDEDDLDEFLELVGPLLPPSLIFDLQQLGVALREDGDIAHVMEFMDKHPGFLSGAKAA
jgi:hypothetical protein